MASHKTVNLRPAWQVANMLRVSRAAISEATKKKYTCAGLPVADWAIKSEGGTVIGYDVPDDIVRALDARENPSLLAEPERERYEAAIRKALKNLIAFAAPFRVISAAIKEKPTPEGFEEFTDILSGHTMSAEEAQAVRAALVTMQQSLEAASEPLAGVLNPASGSKG